MFKRAILLTALLASATLGAQDFPLAWKSSFASSPKITDYSGDGSLVLGVGDGNVEVLDGNTGASKWNMKFKENFGVKSFDKVRWNDVAGIVLLYNTDSKKEKGLEVIVDVNTGKELWRSSDYGGSDAFGYYHFLHGAIDNYFESNHAFAIYNSTKSQMEMVEAKTGKVLWSAPYSGSVSVGKQDGYDVAYIASGDQVDYYDAATGKKIAESDLTKYVTKTNKKEVTGDVKYLDDKDTKIKMSYNKRLVGGAIGSKRDITITSTKISSGVANWSATFQGVIVSTLVTEEDLVSLDVVGDKVYVMYEGITVIDLNTGKVLWSADMDNSNTSVGLKDKQEIGISAMPIVDGNAVYVVDLKKDNDIKKYDATTGKILWESPKMGKDPIVPNMVVSNGVLIAQLGGRINVQTYIPGSNGNPDVYKSEYKFVGPFGLKAYNTTNGQVMWETSTMKDILKDKFSDAITNVLVIGNNVYVCSDKNLFSFDAQSGKANYETGMDEFKIGNPLTMEIDEKDGKIYVICDKGIAAFTSADGKKIYATKVGDILSDFYKGDNYFVWIGENEFAGFDLATGKVKGTFKGQTKPKLTDDGNYLFHFDGSKVVKYKINS